MYPNSSQDVFFSNKEKANSLATLVMLLRSQSN